MRLYIRTQEQGVRRAHVQHDLCFDVRCQTEWKQHIDAVGKNIITSVLKPNAERFLLQGRHLHGRSHKHETHYVPDAAVALADSFGTRSKANGFLQGLVEQGILDTFLWEGCHTLISEDQKFLLGMHYVDHSYGPHVVPVLNDDLEWFAEKVEFERDVMGEVEAMNG